MFPYPCYPEAVPPAPNADIYPVTEQPAENSFNLEDPLLQLRNRQQPRPEDLPPLPELTPPVLPTDGEPLLR
jgi:hypothetical protein